MREIKFRQRIKGMHGVKDYWYYWGYIDGVFIGPKGEVEWDERISYQYIGTKDTINKKEIYEEDIVRVYTWIDEEEPELNDFSVHKVEYKIDDDFPGFDLEPSLNVECNGIQWAICDVESKGIEIVGNTCENPELLENIKKEKR